MYRYICIYILENIRSKIVPLEYSDLENLRSKGTLRQSLEILNNAPTVRYEMNSADGTERVRRTVWNGCVTLTDGCLRKAEEGVSPPTALGTQGRERS